MGFRLFALSFAILGFRVRAWGVLVLRGAAGGLCRASSNQASVKKGLGGFRVHVQSQSVRRPYHRNKDLSSAYGFSPTDDSRYLPRSGPHPKP